MRRHWRPIRRFAAMERKRTCWTSCKPAPICTSTWTTTPTRPSWTSYSPKGRKSDGFEEMNMAQPQSQAEAFKPKKSVALSGVTAGNTALCTVGKTGNDLHYRGYDILDIATECEQLPAGSHPMDVLRTGVSALGCCIAEANDHRSAGARDIADRLLASLGSMLCYWHHYSRDGRRIDVQTDDDSIGAHFLHLLHGRKPSASWVRAMHTSLNLYAEHEFNASTFTARVIAGTGSDLYSCIAGAIGALRGPKHGGANEVAFEIQNRYPTPDAAEADIRQRVSAR